MFVPDIKLFAQCVHMSLSLSLVSQQLTCYSQGLSAEGTKAGAFCTNYRQAVPSHLCCLYYPTVQL